MVAIKIQSFCLSFHGERCCNLRLHPDRGGGDSVVVLTLGQPRPPNQALVSSNLSAGSPARGNVYCEEAKMDLAVFCHTI